MSTEENSEHKMDREICKEEVLRRIGKTRHENNQETEAQVGTPTIFYNTLSTYNILRLQNKIIEDVIKGRNLKKKRDRIQTDLRNCKNRRKNEETGP